MTQPVEWWYAVRDNDSYSSVRYRAVLHPSNGEQEVWIAHNLSHHHAQQIADDHNRLGPDAPHVIGAGIEAAADGSDKV